VECETVFGWELNIEAMYLSFKEAEGGRLLRFSEGDQPCREGRFRFLRERVLEKNKKCLNLKICD
jgi:hypothetical protein